MKLKKEYTRLARLLEQEQKLRAELRELQKKRLGDEGRFTCTEHRQDGIILSIPLPELIAMFPQAKAELIHWTRDDGSVQAYHRFGPELLCDLHEGFHLWVKHETRASEVVPAKAAEIPAAA
jgi:hypothetical protein